MVEVRSTFRGTRLAAVLVVLALAVGAAVAVGTAPSAEAGPTTSTFAAAADGATDASAPTTARPADVELSADADPEKVVYVRFAPTGVGAVSRATLRLHVRDREWAASRTPGQVRAVASTTWTEAGLTHATRPALGAVVASPSGAAVPGHWVDVDVTAQVVANRPVAFAVTSPSSDGVYFDSREAGASGPQLVVTHDPGTPTTTSTTAPTTTTRPPTTTTTTTAPTTTTTTTTPPATGPQTTTLAPAADATVDAGTPSANQGGATSLAAGTSPTRTAYLRFDLSGITTPITGAVLKLHVQDTAEAATTGGGTVVAVPNGSWGESTLTWANRPATDYELWRFGALTRNRWLEVDATWTAQRGPVLSVAVTGTAADLVRFDSREAGGLGPKLVVTHQAGPPPSTDQTVLAAGDIAGCTWDSDEATAKLLDANPVGTIATLGDNVQVDGTAAEFTDCFGPTWGRHKARIKPSVGNHEYHTDSANAYWDYFGAVAGERGKGWYSYDLGPSWHVVVLNGNCWETGAHAQCGPGSAQYAWLQADLAASGKRCTLAYFHQPLFSSVQRSMEVQGLWDALYAGGADLVLNGHKHGYERFAPQRPDGTRDDARGIRQIIVGTGGTPSFYDFGTPMPNSEVRNTGTNGILKLSLKSNSYAWNFLPVAGKTFTDSGSTSCT